MDDRMMDDDCFLTVRSEQFCLTQLYLYRLESKWFKTLFIHCHGFPRTEDYWSFVWVPVYTPHSSGGMYFGGRIMFSSTIPYNRDMDMRITRTLKVFTHIYTLKKRNNYLQCCTCESTKHAMTNAHSSIDARNDNCSIQYSRSHHAVDVRSSCSEFALSPSGRRFLRNLSYDRSMSRNTKKVHIKTCHSSTNDLCLI